MAIDPILDRLAVREVIERYSVALNLRDFATMRDAFRPDGVWRVDPPFDIRLEGEAIIAGIEQMVSGMPFLFQGLLGSIIEVDGNEAHARTSVHEIGQRGTGEGGLESLGLYHDRLVRTDDGWRFAERRFQPLYLDTAAKAGNVVGEP